MTKREMVIREVTEAPETLLDEILGFVRLLRDGPRRDDGHGFREREVARQGLADAGGGCGLARLVRGDVVVLPFPVSDLPNAKRRPALVVATLDGDGLLLCQIPTRATRDYYCVNLDDPDFSEGRLNQPCYIRPNRLLTGDRAMVLYKAGAVAPRILDQAVERAVELLRG
jgi:mRNA interferase MazF